MAVNMGSTQVFFLGLHTRTKDFGCSSPAAVFMFNLSGVVIERGLSHACSAILLSTPEAKRIT